MVSPVMAALALLVALVVPSIAQDGRISATFYQAQHSKAATAPPDNVVGPFKADPKAPIHVEADRLVEVFDGAKHAVFSGLVKLHQGDIVLKTTTLTALYLGQSGFSNGGEWRAEQLTRAEASEVVLVISKDGQTTATGHGATLDVENNTIILTGSVVVSHRKDVAQGPRLKIDLTTGMYRYEIESLPAPPPAPAAQKRPQ